MAETQIPTATLAAGKAALPVAPSPNGQTQQKRGPSIHQIYALPAPIRTFPLPAFHPNNPVSLFHLAYAWLSQTFSGPPAEPVVIHHGVWSETTTSIHITDEKSMRALWEQGFYGKGTLSRSEPNWLKREKVRRGLQEAHVSEILTVQRREERQQAKWERARLEQEVIRQTRLEEAGLTESRRQAKLGVTACSNLAVVAAPVGPRELLLLPNSAAEVSTHQQSIGTGIANSVVANGVMNGLSISPDLSLIERLTGIETPDISTKSNGSLSLGDLEGETDGTTPDESRGSSVAVNGHTQPDASKHEASSTTSSDSAETNKSLKRQKSVRFSPTVESTTFQLSDPPSPNLSLSSAKAGNQPLVNGNHIADAREPSASAAAQSEGSHVSDAIVNKEHLQLTPEEALFLSFGLGALTVSDPMSGRTLSSADMCRRFREHSYFPPRVGPDAADLQPDDPFLVHYAVYHHFRSLGWVPRAGIKFGVDWLLYTRGPVFDHAEFGLIVVPSYSDTWWKSVGKRGPEKTWRWLHSIVRVLSHVVKSLVLVYVDVPSPVKFDEALKSGLADALKLYTVREVMVKRWSSNRNR